MENIIVEKSQSIATLQKKIEALQSLVAARWNYSWRPALDALSPKMFLKLSQVRRNGGMCIKMLKTEWIPVIKDQWFPLISSLGSHFEPLTAKIIEAYHVSENLLLSSTAKIQTTFSPFIQELPIMKDQWLTFIYSLCSCFVSLTAKITEVYRVTKNSLLSHTVKIQTSTAPFIRPNSGKSVWACRMLVTSIISYHNQVQQWLKTNKLTRSLASIELAWLAATALLCLPVVCLCRFYSAIFRKRGRKLGRTSHPNNIRRKLKRTLSID
ncbi:uncharacterized protein LOC114730796 [Neltuma alba]|uniref:uncharacterized protein LOC114730796 n=1 Tax=Neltuma alba TaxID=207710 RepID=UPI0010A33C0D|nr:uncharacterized protein LOC114730796 [Prosopis alba]